MNDNEKEPQFKVINPDAEPTDGAIDALAHLLWDVVKKRRQRKCSQSNELRLHQEEDDAKKSEPHGH